MTRALVDHRARVERMWRSNVAALVEEAELSPTTTESPPSGRTGLFLRPHITAEDPASGLLVETTVDALVPGQHGDHHIEQAKLGRWNMRRRLIETAGARQLLQTAGLSIGRQAVFILSDCSRVAFELGDATDDWSEATLAVAQLADQIAHDRVDLDWDTSPLDQCGRESCAWCQLALRDSDDLFHIARLRRSTRRILRQSGVRSMHGLAESSIDEVTRAVSSIDPERLRRDHLQASLQVLTEHSRDGRPPATVVEPERLSALAPGEPGDIYLDFEGDPAYREWEPDGVCGPGVTGPATWLGIDYLIGLIEQDTGSYRYWWATSWAEEATAWSDFVDWLGARLHQYPQLRIYHYASYELTALRRLAERHGIGQELVASLVESDHLVDLYRETMASMVIGTEGYSLKDLEGLYFDGSERSGIRGGGESVLAFESFQQATPERAQEIREAIVAYNEVDCRSTQALHAWLIDQQDTEHH